MKEMVGGCCVCSDERGWDENPLVYCDGNGCNVAVHQGMERCDRFVYKFFGAIFNILKILGVFGLHATISCSHFTF